MYLDTVLNDPRKVCARMVKQNITKNVMVYANRNKVPAGAPWGKDTDEKYNILKGFFMDNNVVEYDVGVNVIVRLPVALPLPRESRIKCG